MSTDIVLPEVRSTAASLRELAEASGVRFLLAMFVDLAEQLR